MRLRSIEADLISGIHAAGRAATRDTAIVDSVRTSQVGAADESRAASVAAEVDRALNDVAVLAVDGVRGCDAAGVSLAHDGLVSTVAATNAQVLEVDAAQYRRGDGPCLTALRDGEVVRVDDFTADRRWPSVAAEALAAGVRSVLSMPLDDGVQVVGALNMYAVAPGAFDEDSRRIALLFARQSAMALRYMRLLHREQAERAAEHRIAETLQRSLLPSLPQLDGVACAARYLVGAEAAQVGGDWYDVFALPDGAVGIAIGDVMGHDIAAAAAMGQLRSVLRSYAYEGSSPSTVFDRMDRLVQGFDMAQMATAVYARLVTDRAGAMMLFANAGHLPPLLRHPDGSVQRLDGASSRLIGAPAPALRRPRTEAAIDLPVGSTLLLYTDGLVEGRHRDIDDGIEALRRVVAGEAVDLDPDGLCDAVIEAMVGDDQDDDIALVALHVLGS